MIADTPTQSPFKFLDAYTARDTDRFFGRQAEQQRLIELIFSSRLILLYGASGTGKSSLVQCGLAQAFSRADYFPVVLRRRDNFPASLVNTLSELVRSRDTTDPVALTQQLVNFSLSPVYLIFDQFEELFISGSADEQQAFFSQLKALFDSGVLCKLLLVMREEYLAYLYRFEEELPSLFDFRLRVEPMRERSLDEVIVGTFSQVKNIRLESADETVSLIIKNTKSDKNVFQLPYLQVYLDRLWKVGYERSRLLGEPVIRIDPALAESVGAIDDVLELFLREQKEAVKQGLPPDQQPMVDKVLEAFVTFEGTRREHTLETLSAELGGDRAGLSTLLKQLESLRILHEDEGLYELPHDSLAKVIDRGRSSEQRQLNDIIRRLKDAYREYRDKKEAEDLLLPSRRVAEVVAYEETLKTELAKTSESEGIWQFIETSRQLLQRKQQAELAEQQRKNNRLKRTIAGVGILLVLAVVSLVIAFLQRQQARQSAFRANALHWASESDKLPPAQAIRLLEQAAQYALETGPVYERLLRRFNESDSLALNQLDLIHQAGVNSAAFSPDGSRILTASKDGTAKVWDLKGQLLATLTHQDWVLSAAFSPDGSRILTASVDGTGKVWDLQGQLLATLAHGREVFLSATFSSDGNRILTASANGMTKVWDLKGQLLASLTHQAGVNSAAFSPDGSRILTASVDGTGKVWDLQGQLLATLAHGSAVYSAAFSPDGSRILTASDDGTAKVWDLQEQLLASLTHQDKVNSVVFSPDGSRILTASADGTAKVWDLTGKRLSTLTHGGDVYSAAFFPDGGHIVTASSDKIAKVWDLKGQLLASLTHQDVVNSVAFSPDGSRILTATEDGTAKIWDLQEQRLASLTHQDVVNSVVFSPDGSRILTASEDGTAKVWDLTGKRLATLTHQAGVNSAAFSPDGKRILTTSADSTAKVWDLKGKRLATLTHQDMFNSAAFSPDGNRILTVSLYDGTANVWDLQGKPLATLTHQAGVTTAAFFPDGSRILTTPRSGAAQVWNLKGQLLASLTHQAGVNSVVFSPDGSRILTASEDGTAKVWDLTGKRLATLTHGGDVYSAAFSPDGGHIITASSDKTAKVWDLKGQLLTKLTHGGAVYSAAFSPDGNRIVTASEDGTAKVWFTSEGALDWLKKNTQKVAPLTEENKKKYGIIDE